MGEEYEIVDRSGRPTGERARRVGGGGGCFTGLAFWAIVIVLIIAGIIFAVSKLTNAIQANALPLHDSLRNVSTQSPGCSSDSDGYHVVSSWCTYSNVLYGDVDVSVTAKLVKGSPHAAYGLVFRNDVSEPTFAITSDGKWFYYGDNNSEGTIQGKETPSAAIKQGTGATNTIEVHTHGEQYDFFINGVNVGGFNDIYTTVTEGRIGFISGNAIDAYFDTSGRIDTGENDVEAVFTDLSITRHG